jgi:hypothetical protein
MYPMMTLSSFEAVLYRTASAPKGHLLGHALYLVFKDRFGIFRATRERALRIE